MNSSEAIKRSNHDNDDETYTAFLTSSSGQVDKQVYLDLDSSRYICRLNKKVNTINKEMKDEDNVKYEPSQDVLERYSGQSFRFDSVDHTFEVKIKNEIQQRVSHASENQLRIGSYDSEKKDSEGRLYQYYTNGDECNLQSGKVQREAQVYFQCSTLVQKGQPKVLAVTEPQMCKYKIIIGISEACPNHPDFRPLVSINQIEGAVKGFENWFLMVSLGKGHHNDSSARVICRAQNIGFGQLEMIQSQTMGNFELSISKTGIRSQTDKTPCKILDWEAKYGDRKSFKQQQEEEMGVKLSADGSSLVSAMKAKHFPNYLEIHV